MRQVKKLESPIVPKEIIKTTNEDLEKGGREGNLENLKELSLGYENVGDDTFALVFPKLKTYSPTPGWDNMIYIAKEEGSIKSIEDLDPKKLSKVMAMGNELFNVYKDTPEQSPLALKFISVNFHADPLPEKNAFGNRKLLAQTLNDLHIHFGAYSEREVGKIEHLQKRQRQPAKEGGSEIRISRTEYDDVNDPMAYLVERLSTVPAIEQQMTKNLNVIHLDEAEKQYIGVNFSVNDKRLLDSPELAQDLITLHKNMEQIYVDIGNLIIDLDNMDSTGMPRLRTPEEQTQMINDYAARVGIDLEQADPTVKKTFRNLARLGRVIKSGETISTEIKDKQELVSNDGEQIPDPRIFLKSFAYTLSIIDNP